MHMAFKFLPLATAMRFPLRLVGIYSGAKTRKQLILGMGTESRLYPGSSQVHQGGPIFSPFSITG